MRFAIALAVALIVAFVFLPVLSGQFLSWDDDALLTNNPAFRGLGPAQLAWMATTTRMGHYMPLTWLTFGATYVAAGMNPWAYHVGSLLLHALDAALVTWLAWRLIGLALAGDGARAGVAPLAVGAAVAGLAFGIHPLRAESVAWITDRSDLLCAAFVLLALLAYLRAVEAGALSWRPWGILSLSAMAAALLSKEIAVTLPALLLVLDAYPLRRPAGWAERLREKWPFWALALVGAVAAVLARSAGARFTPLAEYGVGARLAMAAHSLWYVVIATVWPLGRLAPYHEPPAPLDPLALRFLGPALAVVAVTVALVLLRRRWPAGLAAWAASGAVLLPVSGLLHSGSQLVAERYAYLPGVALALLLGGAAASVLRAAAGRPRRRIAAAALLAFFALAFVDWSIIARAHARSWRDGFTFWQVSAAADPGCRLCVLNLSSEHFNAGRFAESEAWARRAIPLWPNRGTPHHRLGAALLMQGRDAEAERELREAIRLAPRLAEAHRELGRLYARQGRAAEAATAMREALLLGVPPAEVEAVLRPLDGSSPAGGAGPAGGSAPSSR